jgi:2-polyprenyl-6-methoxyphenol hydroxylase-like FAD-dependent oxidoreductase
VHVVGAGPVGLMLTALLQSVEGFSVRLYEKRHEYTRTRMVQLAPYLVADSVDSYRTDYIDGDNIDAVFDPAELREGLAFRRSIPADLMELLRDWTTGFCPLNSIERTVSELIDARPANGLQRTKAVVTADDAIAMLEPGDVLIDCTGANSLLRAHLSTANTLKIRLEYALVITFLYGQRYDCNEYCKYSKNADNPQFKFIPMVHRTHYDGSVSHVTGIVNISAEDYEAMPSLDLYRARNATSRQWLTAGPTDHPFATSPAFLAGDSAIGSPYFQSISLVFECAMYLAGLIAQRDLPLRDMLDRYELYSYKQWLRVYMRSKMIKHNKDLFETIDDPLALLEKLHIY